MKERVIETEGYLFNVRYHPEQSRHLTEVKIMGAAMVGVHSLAGRRPNAAVVDYRLEVCDWNRQLFGIRRYALAGEGYQGIRIPRHVYLELLKHFRGWLYPPADMLETNRYTYIFRLPLKMDYREIRNEIETLTADKRILEHIRKIREQNQEELPDSQQELERQIEFLAQRIGELFAEITRRLSVKG